MAPAVSAPELVAAVRRNSDAIVQTWGRLLGSARARIAADFAGGTPDAWLATVVALLERPGQAAAAHRALVQRAAESGLSGDEIAHAYANLGEALVHALLRDPTIPNDRRLDVLTLALRIFEQGQKWLYQEWAEHAAVDRTASVDCRQIVDLATDVIIALDAEMRVALVNPALTAVTGFSAGEVVGHSIETIVSQRSGVLLTKFWQTNASAESPSTFCELELRTKGSDAVVPIDASCIAIPDADGPAGALIIGRDVRKRRQTELLLQRQNRLLAAINAIAQAVGGSLELQETLHAALGEAVNRLRADLATIHILDADNNVLRLAAHAGVSDELAAAVANVPTTEGLLAEVARGDSAVIADGGATERAVYAPVSDEQPAATTAIVPLIARGQSLGVIAVGYLRPQRFDESDRQLLTVIGRQIGTAIDNAMLYERARQAAMRDSLTGLYDHGEVWRRLEAETERCRRYGRKLSFLYADLDNLKAINDTYGHIVGDAVLRGIADILTESVRAADTASRYGGDEFAVILPEASLADAATAAERIRKAVAEATFHAPGVKSAARATLSIGVADWRPEMNDAAGLVHAADLAQYQAKARGGNAVGVLERGGERSDEDAGAVAGDDSPAAPQ